MFFICVKLGKHKDKYGSMFYFELQQMCRYHSVIISLADYARGSKNFLIGVMKYTVFRVVPEHYPRVLQYKKCNIYNAHVVYYHIWYGSVEYCDCVGGLFVYTCLESFQLKIPVAFAKVVHGIGPGVWRVVNALGRMHRIYVALTKKLPILSHRMILKCMAISKKSTHMTIMHS